MLCEFLPCSFEASALPLSFHISGREQQQEEQGHKERDQTHLESDRHCPFSINTRVGALGESLNETGSKTEAVGQRSTVLLFLMDHSC